MIGLSWNEDRIRELLYDVLRTDEEFQAGPSACIELIAPSTKLASSEHGRRVRR